MTTTNFGLSEENVADLANQVDTLVKTIAQHVHDGSTVGAIEAVDPPEVTVETTGGFLEAGIRYLYAITRYEIATGLESLLSAPTEAVTPDHIAVPDAPLLDSEPTGGAFIGGAPYAYKFTAYIGNTYAETPAGPAIEYVVPVGTNTNVIRITFPELPAGATGWNIYRLDPGAQSWGFWNNVPMIDATPPTYFDDTGLVSPDCLRLPPEENTTGDTCSALVEYPDEALPAGYRWRIYRTDVPDQWENSLVHDVIENADEDTPGVPATSWLDTGEERFDVSPPDEANPIPNPAKVSLPDHTVGNLDWSRITGVPSDLGGGATVVLGTVNHEFDTDVGHVLTDDATPSEVIPFADRLGTPWLQTDSGSVVSIQRAEAVGATIITLPDYESEDPPRLKLWTVTASGPWTQIGEDVTQGAQFISLLAAVFQALGAAVRPGREAALIAVGVEGGVTLTEPAGVLVPLQTPDRSGATIEVPSSIEDVGTADATPDTVAIFNIDEQDPALFYTGVGSDAVAIRLPATQARSFFVRARAEAFGAIYGPDDDDGDDITIDWATDTPTTGTPMVLFIASTGGSYTALHIGAASGGGAALVSAAIPDADSSAILAVWPAAASEGTAAVLRRRLEDNITTILLPGDTHEDAPAYRPGSVAPVVTLYIIQGKLGTAPADYAGADPGWFGNDRVRPGSYGADGIPAEAGYAIVLRLEALGDDLDTCDWAVHVVDDHFDHDGRPVVASTEVELDAGVHHPVTIEATAARGETLTYTLVDEASDGGLYQDGVEVLAGETFDPTDNLTFMAASSFTGTDSFTWRATAAGFTGTDGDSNVATWAVTVTAFAPPTVNDIDTFTNVDDPVIVTLSGSDPNGRLPLTWDIDEPANGIIGGGVSANRQYVPNTEWFGVETIAYRATNTAGAVSEDGTITIGVSNPVVADDDTLTGDVDETVAITLSATDPHSTGTMTYEILSAPDGVVTPGSTSSVSSRNYTPDSGFEGDAVITYRASNGIRWSEPATITITYS